MARSGNPRGNPKPNLGVPDRKKFLVCCLLTNDDDLFIMKNDVDGIKAFDEHNRTVHGKAAAE
jgi:hypothetical protein